MKNFITVVQIIEDEFEVFNKAFRNEADAVAYIDATVENYEMYGARVTQRIGNKLVELEVEQEDRPRTVSIEIISFNCVLV